MRFSFRVLFSFRVPGSVGKNAERGTNERGTHCHLLRIFHCSGKIYTVFTFHSLSMMPVHSPIITLLGFIHALGALLFFLGIAALIVWAFKKWTKEEFKKVGMWLTIIGAVLCILALLFSFHVRKFSGGQRMMIRGDNVQGGSMMRQAKPGWIAPDQDQPTLQGEAQQ